MGLAGEIGSAALAALAEAHAVEQAHHALLKRLGMSEKELERAVNELRTRESFKQVGLGGRLPGEVDIKNYPLFAYRAGASAAVAPYLVPLFYMIPIVGQGVAITEAVIGRSVLTGEKLAAWERALTLTLAAIPHARGLWGGLRATARVARSIDGAIIWLAVRSTRSVRQVIGAVARVGGLRPAGVRLAITETRQASQLGTSGRAFSATHRATAQKIAHAFGARPTRLLLGPGKPGRVIPNKLNPREVAFAKEIVDHRGGLLEGAARRSQPGIDGMLEGAPISLKETNGGMVSVLKYASVAESQAKKFRYTGVEVFIRAPNVAAVKLADFAKKGGLVKIPRQGTVSAINVLTKDGWLRIP